MIELHKIAQCFFHTAYPTAKGDDELSVHRQSLLYFISNPMVYRCSIAKSSSRECSEGYPSEESFVPTMRHIHASTLHLRSRPR